MKKQTSLVKIAVVASSVLLAAGFICYRAGAFNEIKFPAGIQGQPVNSPPSAEAGETVVDAAKSAEVVREAGKSDEVALKPVLIDAHKSATIMSGSKSLIITEAPIRSGTLTIIGGSKSGVLELLSPTPAP